MRAKISSPHYIHVRRTVILLTLLLCIWGNATETKTPSREWQITEINSKIAALQAQIDRLQEQKRRLIDLPDVPPPTNRRVEETHIHTGPRNGKYHYTPSGKKVYDRRRNEQKN